MITKFLFSVYADSDGKIYSLNSLLTIRIAHHQTRLGKGLLPVLVGSPILVFDGNPLGFFPPYNCAQFLTD